MTALRTAAAAPRASAREVEVCDPEGARWRAAPTPCALAEEAHHLTGEAIAFDQAPDGEGRTGYCTCEPVGVVLAITPFNDPLNPVARKIGPAMA